MDVLLEPPTEEVTFGKSLRERRGLPRWHLGERVPPEESEQGSQCKGSEVEAWSACSGTVRRPVGLRAGVTESSGDGPERRGAAGPCKIL